MSHPRHELDELLLHPVRLSVVAALSGVDRAEFGLVRDCVEVSDSFLSKQVAQLENAGHVEVLKGRVDRRSRTWLRLTPQGVRAYERHVQALTAIASSSAAESTVLTPRPAVEPTAERDVSALDRSDGHGHRTSPHRKDAS